MSKKAWNSYLFEFISIFVAIVAAFALTKWNDDRKDNLAEEKILIEILSGLEKDKEDIKANVGGHQQGISACDFWIKVFNDRSPSLDSVETYYYLLTRDFISIQNNSGYETLKSRGFELIKNDTLRSRIIALYEFDYQILSKLEEEYEEIQFHKSYFKELNNVIAPYLQFDTEGHIIGIDLPLNLPNQTKRRLMTYLWKIKKNRTFILSRYTSAGESIESLSSMIHQELDRK